jgi:hypothetical protein
VRREKYEDALARNRQISFELYQSLENLEELEKFQFTKGQRYLPFPDYEYSFKHQETGDERPFTRISLSAKPLQSHYHVDTYRLNFEESSDYIKNLLIRQAGELFRKKGEADMRQVIESLSQNDDRKIY